MYSAKRWSDLGTCAKTPNGTTSAGILKSKVETAGV